MKLSFFWRFILGLGLVLPLGLSAVYEDFSGSESAMRVDAITYTGNASYYSLFAPPGVQSLGEQIGISLFFNATLDFAVNSSPQNGSEPPIPTHAQAYGFNMFSLNNESAAMLDIPQPIYVSAVQNMLTSGESWSITAPVMATVATFNNSKIRNEQVYESYLKTFCEAAEESSGAYARMTMLNGWSIKLVSHASPGDQSLQYIGLYLILA